MHRRRQRTIFGVIFGGAFLVMTNLPVQAQQTDPYLLSRLVQQFIIPGGGLYGPYTNYPQDPYRGPGRYQDPRDPYTNDSYRETDRRYQYDNRRARLEHKYNKAMRRLAREEQRALERAYNKYNGNTSHPGYRERLADIDRKFEHKRFKVERNIGKDYRRLTRRYGYDDGRPTPSCGINYNRSAY